MLKAVAGPGRVARVAGGNYALTDPSAFTNRIILVGVLVLVAGVAGHVIGQRQVGQLFHWTDLSDDQPTAEAYETAGMAIPTTAGD